ncbi:MAG: phage polymerase-related protein [Thermoleophilia bacterium]|nr:phage polymerase-related protein [Thermoleophilia bacterium]
MHPREPVTRAGRIRARDLATVALVEEYASGCELCRLCRDRTTVVTGSGPHDADVLVVAEAPGYHDDRTGVLLAGPVGHLFDTILADAGLTRAKIFLTSVVKCRPPTGRTPFPDEVESCEGWLFREIQLVQPKIVVTLGQLALRLVTGRQEQLREVHGAMLHAHVQGRDVVVWPLFHPAAAVHVDSLTSELRADARALGTLLQGARSAPQPRSAADDIPSPLPEPVPAAVVPAPVSDDPDTGEPQLAFDV